MSLENLNKKKASPKTVLGVDASTNSLAYCLYGADGPIKWGEIKFDGGNIWERLADGQAKIMAVKKDLKSDLIVFESAVYIQNKKTVILLAYSFGALIAALMNKGTVIGEVAPMTWQNAITNKPLTKQEKDTIKQATPGKSDSWYSNQYRNIRKQRTMTWVKDTYDIDCDSDNISDAIAISSVAYKEYCV